MSQLTFTFYSFSTTKCHKIFVPQLQICSAFICAVTLHKPNPKQVSGGQGQVKSILKTFTSGHKIEGSGTERQPL